jgi:hypothetical protein
MMERKIVARQQAFRVQCSIHMYEAEISVKAILSYKPLWSILAGMDYISKTSVWKSLYQE